MTHDDESAQPSSPQPSPSQPEAIAVASPLVARLPPWLLRTVELLLPLALAGAAVGVHWWVNVPATILESPNDQGAKDKASKDKDKKKKDAERRAKRDESRTPEELDADWERYRVEPFDDEPTRTAWARRHQVVINRAMVEARRQAFVGAPEEPNVVLASTTCRTVRCRFLLRSPFDHELELITAALERLHTEGELVWRSFEVEPVVSPPEAAEATKVVQITVAFHTDDTEANALEIPPAKPENGVPESGVPEPENGEPESG